jgi:hypothetical protein
MKAGALVITFPRSWETARRLEFMAAVAQGIPPARWASVAEPGRTVEIAASVEERRSILARLTERRARGVDEHPVSMLERTE